MGLGIFWRGKKHGAFWEKNRELGKEILRAKTEKSIQLESREIWSCNGMEHLQILYDIAWPRLYHDLYSPRHLLLFHTLVVMLLWNYFSIVSTDSGGVPLNWKPMVDEEKGDVDPLMGSEHTGVG